MKFSLIFFLFFCINLYSQNIQSIIKMSCRCEPLTYFEKVHHDKIFYIEVENPDAFYDLKKVTFHILEKIGNQWFKSNEHIVSEEYEFVHIEDQFKYENLVSINNNQYYYSILDFHKMGAAYNDFKTIAFIFYDINKEESPIILLYERLFGEFSGRYSINGSDINFSYYKEFIKHTNLYVEHLFGKNNYDIDHEDNFKIKWEMLNDKLYLSDYKYDLNDFKINFVEFNTINFYNNFKDKSDSELENSKYKAIAGFCSPVFIYNKKENKSAVVFIPEGWPNGAGWGFRSFYLKSLQDELLTIESEDYIIRINLSKQTLSSIKK